MSFGPRIYISAAILAVTLGMVTIVAALQQINNNQRMVVLSFGDAPSNCQFVTSKPITLQEAQTVKTVGDDSQEVKVIGLLYAACVDKNHPVPQNDREASFSWADEQIYKLDPKVTLTSDALKCVAAEAARKYIDNFPAYKGHMAIYVGTYPITDNLVEECK